MELLEHILKQLVSHPDDIKVERMSDDMGVLLSVNLNQEDMGKVIGKQGQTAQAIRHIIRVWGLIRGQRISVKIIDPAGTRFVRLPPETIST